MKVRLLLPAFLVVLAAPAAFAQDYAVQMQRPLKAGDTLTISITGKGSQAVLITADGVVQKDAKDEVIVQLDGVEKVLAIDANGKESKVSITVDKLTVSENGAEPEEIAPKGSEIIATSADKKQTYEMNGALVPEAIASALELVVDLSHNDPTNDEVFGTKEHKKKGDSWDLNGDAVRKALEGGNDKITFSNITGKATLDDVADGVMKVSIHFTGGMKSPLPEGLTLDTATVDETIKESCPVDAAKYETDDLQEATIVSTAHPTKPGPKKVVVKSTIGKSMARKFGPAK